MTRQSLSRAAGLVGRGIRTSTIRTASFAPRRAVLAPKNRALLPSFITRSRFLSISSSQNKGILPDSDNPAPPNVQDDDVKPLPADLTEAEYHQVADDYLEVIFAELEKLADKNESIEVEFSVRISTLPLQSTSNHPKSKAPTANHTNLTHPTTYSPAS